jgi:hypothetical protein
MDAGMTDLEVGHVLAVAMNIYPVYNPLDPKSMKSLAAGREADRSLLHHDNVPYGVHSGRSTV